MSNYPITLNGFLALHKHKDGKEITHTKIGNASMGIYGGKFSIPDEAMDDFWKLYHKNVFVDGNPSYLTESQRKNAGPMLIDIDERYNNDIDERQHTDEHIIDLVELFIEKIRTFMEWNHDTYEEAPRVFIFEKDNANTTNDEYTKDGIHIVIDICVPYAIQMAIRDKVLKDIDNIFEDLPLINDYDSLVDSKIPSGINKWQVFGSKKPGNEAYKIRKIYAINIDEDDDLEFEDFPINMKNGALKILKDVSARNLDLKQAVLTDSAEELVKKWKVIKGKRKAKIKMNSGGGNNNQLFSMGIFETIDSEQKCNAVVDQILQMAKTNDEYDIIMAHDMVNMLNENYYEPYDKWMEVGWALKTVSPLLYPIWLKFSAKSDKFNWVDNDCYKMWHEHGGNGALTLGSLRYWARECCPDDYDKIKNECVDYHLNKTVECEEPNEYDVARLVYVMFEGKYKCTNIKNKIWYEYKGGKWKEIDCGTTLRQALSTRINKLYAKKIHAYVHLINTADDAGGEKVKELRLKNTALSKMALKLKKTSWKQNIMRECCECFFDGNFINLLDKNTDLLSFKNGVLDMGKKEFRESRSDDYLSLCTNTNYIEYNPEDDEHVEIRSEITEFMEQLFPDPSLNIYMWEHLASVLIGDNRNQTFHIYTGCGRNGKSKLVELMGLVLGEYKGSVPLALITQKRGSIGGVSPEVAQLKGLRYAVMQEPSKNTKMNEGIMKELTGGDPIQGRALFKDTVTFIPQFTLAVCTNHLFDIQSADDGTWRRIRVCNFASKFVDNPSDKLEDLEFKVDRNIDKKFKRWIPIFTSMLVEILFKTDGLVTDCDAVLAPTQKYKAQQDYFTGFLKERIVKLDGSKIKKRDVLNEFQEWFSELYGGKVPTGKELYEFLEKELGKPTRLGWKGYKLYHAHDLVDDMDIQPNGL